MSDNLVEQEVRALLEKGVQKVKCLNKVNIC